MAIKIPIVSYQSKLRNNTITLIASAIRSILIIGSPSLLVVSGDEVIFFDTETSFVSGDITPSEYWNSFNESAKMQELNNVFLEYLES